MLDTIAKDPKAPQTQPRAPRRESRVRLIVRCSVLALVAMFIAECLRIFVGGNFHSVVSGRCYRSGQPTAEFLEAVHRTHDIKAVLNLRDENNDEPWYQEEKETAERLGIKLINAGLSGSEPTGSDDFAKFVKALDACPEPMLIHCANGNDRTGFASTFYLLMRTDTPLPEARRQLSLRYGHFSWGKAGCLQRMLDSYEAWLAKEHYEHTAEHLRFWGCHIYRPEPLPNRVAAVGNEK
ncbi:MAG TPA: tyrosine-protein phosphatase [Gemmataceae bacterium]|nr:tyrosine-protein phosphatase [Gemmataceae bacterium]